MNQNSKTTKDIQKEIKKINVNWPYFTGIILDERRPNSNHSKSHYNYCEQSFHFAWTFSTLWCVKTICCDDIIEHLPVSRGYLPFFLKTIVDPQNDRLSHLRGRLASANDSQLPHDLHQRNPIPSQQISDGQMSNVWLWQKVKWLFVICPKVPPFYICGTCSLAASYKFASGAGTFLNL